MDRAFCLASQKHGTLVCQCFRQRNKSSLINSINFHVCNALVTEPRWIIITTVPREDLKKKSWRKTGADHIYSSWHVEGALRGRS